MDQDLAGAAMARSDPGPIERVRDPKQEWARSAGRASGGWGLYRRAWTTGITVATVFVLAIFLLADAGLPRALSSEVDTGSREENATKQKGYSLGFYCIKTEKAPVVILCALAGVLMPQF
jgi:hypothetical protein